MLQFLRKRADETFQILESIPNDVPTPDIASWRKIDFPTLVLANRNDPQHPFEYGQALAQEIPGARFAEITRKRIRRVTFRSIRELTKAITITSGSTTAIRNPFNGSPARAGSSEKSIAIDEGQDQGIRNKETASVGNRGVALENLRIRSAHR